MEIIMKARTIKRLRKKISEKGYYKRRLNDLTLQLENWHNFEINECSSSFVGYERAKYNQLNYDAHQPRLAKKVDWYFSKIEIG